MVWWLSSGFSEQEVQLRIQKSEPPNSREAGEPLAAARNQTQWDTAPSEMRLPGAQSFAMGLSFLEPTVLGMFFGFFSLLVLLIFYWGSAKNKVSCYHTKSRDVRVAHCLARGNQKEKRKPF